MSDETGIGPSDSHIDFQGSFRDTNRQTFLLRFYFSLRSTFSTFVRCLLCSLRQLFFISTFCCCYTARGSLLLYVKEKCSG